MTAYRCDPFGVLLAQTGSFEQPFGFSTKRYHAQLGMVQYEYRNYFPDIARWDTRDPLGEAGGLNLYAFVGNNPVNWVDPWGEEYIEGDYGQPDWMTVVGQDLVKHMSPATPIQYIEDVSNFSAGFGDTISFGGTRLIRRGVHRLQMPTWDDPADTCSIPYIAGNAAGYAWWAAFNSVGYAQGYEFKFGKNFRIAPWGNRTNHPIGRFPHYHRRIVDSATGKTIPGGGIGRHRPLEGW